MFSFNNQEGYGSSAILCSPLLSAEFSRSVSELIDEISVN